MSDKEKARIRSKRYIERHPERQHEAEVRYREKHREEIKQRGIEWRSANKEKLQSDKKICYEATKEFNKEQRRDYHFLYEYGITIADYNEMVLAQNGRCLICGNTEQRIDPKSKKLRNLCVDHDHITGKVRGLLCGKCNSFLGLANDDPVLLIKAIKYLENS